MEEKYQHLLPGQEVAEAELNLIATEAALADDKVFAELFRIGAGSRGVTTASGGVSAIIQPTGSSDASVKINAFRAFIGPLSPSTAQDAYKNGRSAVQANAASNVGTILQFPAATNNRWDLVYARVDIDIDSSSVNRFVKTGSTPATQQSVVTTKKTTVTIGRVAGTEAATPAKPALPADSGSSYYISLGYVLLLAGHTLVTPIATTRIDENAPIVNISTSTGGNSLRPANGMFAEAGIVLTNETWTVALGRPKAYLPPTLSGATTLIIALKEVSTPRTVTLGSTGIIDDSADWRKRLFKVTVTYGSGDFGWNGGSPNVPSAGTTGTVTVFLGQSMNDPAIANKSALAQLDNTSTGGVMAAGSTMFLYVDKTDGKIKCDMGATAPGCNFLFWVEATGRFDNCL